MRFELGQLMVTCGISAAMEGNEAFHRFVMVSLDRYRSCDWGELPASDREANDIAVTSRENRIFAAYVSKELQKKIWIITEADRRYTRAVSTGILNPNSMR